MEATSITAILGQIGWLPLAICGGLLLLGGLVLAVVLNDLRLRP